MSLPVDVYVRTAPGDEVLTLARFVADLDGGALEVLAAPCGLDHPVQAVLIWDATEPEAIEPGTVVLGVGVGAESPGLVSLIEAAGRAGASAVVIKSPGSTKWARAVAERVGVTVFGVRRDLGWDQVHLAVRTAIAAGRAAVLDGTDGPVGDLFELANAAAATLGGPVEIDDPGLSLLAFSNLHVEVDELRRQSILGRIPPPAFLDWLRTGGVLRRMRATWEPIRLEPPGARPRLVVPIRAGADVLGYIWLSQGEEELGPRQAIHLAEIARLASVQILRRRAVEDVDRRLCRESLRGALEGSGDSAIFAARLGVARHAAFRLVGLQPRDGWGGDQTLPLLVEGLVGLRIAVLAQHAAVVTTGDTIYSVVPADAIDADGTCALLDEISRQACRQLGVELIGGVGSAAELDGLVEARREIDRVLRLVQADPKLTVATCDDVRPHAVLAELRELAAANPQLLRGRIEILRDLDRTRNTDYIATMRAFFDAACDLTVAAKLLFVHRNTLRYRIQRIEELSGLDLSDPVERLVAELQLHLVAA